MIILNDLDEIYHQKNASDVINNAPFVKQKLIEIAFCKVLEFYVKKLNSMKNPN